MLESENLVSNATARTKTALGVIQFWLNYFTSFFFKALGIHVCSKATERGVSVVSVFHPFPYFVYKDDHDSLSNFWCFSRTPGNLTHTIRPTNSSIQGFEHFRLDCIATH